MRIAGKCFGMKGATAALLLLIGIVDTWAGEPAESWDVTAARGSTRDVDFDTQEGTWMSMDPSPDGQWIVFDLLAHVYRVPVSGGAAQCLTQNSGVALNFHPRYSPDGKTIAFISDRRGQNNLWLMDADGSNARPVSLDPGTRASQPAWTPDGQYIVVRRETTSPGYSIRTTLWMYGKDGGAGIELVGSSVPDADWPSLSPDGHFVYFQAPTGASSELEERDAVKGAYQIKRLDLRSGNIEEITAGNSARMYRGSSGGAIAPEVSPDGRWLTFARRIPNGTISYKGHQLGPRTALWIRDLSTGAERVLLDPIEQDMSEGMKVWRVLPGYSWARDSKSLVISQGGHIQRVWIDGGKRVMVPFTAHVHRTLSEMAYASRPASGGAFEARALRWHTPSPDGKRMVFQAVGHLWLMDLAASVPHRLTAAQFSAYEYSPAWSPDGRWIAFTTWDERAGGQLWKVSSTGGTPQNLTVEPAEYINPAWSADGSQILLARGSGATLRGRAWASNPWYDVVQVPAKGGKASWITRIDRPGGELVELIAWREIPAPAFGPGGRIYFLETTPTKTEGSFFETHLVSVRADGTDRRTHLIFPTTNEAAISPDGRWLAYQESDNLYLMAFPLLGTGGQPPLVDRSRPVFAVRSLSTEGGNFPHWRDTGTLTFGSANRFFVYDLASGRTESHEIHLQVPRDTPRGTVALVGARIITLDQRRVIDKGTVIVKDDRIVCVGSCDASRADRTIDAQGKTIIPGFIDMHAHHYREYNGITPPHDFEHAAYLAYGVTTTLDPSAWSQNVFPIGELTEAGGMIGPRTFSTGEPLNRGSEAHWNEITDYAGAEHEIARRKSYGAVALKQYLQPRRDQRQWTVDVARKQHLTVTSEGDSLEYNIGTTLDGQTGWEHALSYAPLYGDASTFFGKAGIAYSATIIVGGAGPWNEEYLFQSSDLWKDPKLARWTPWLELLPHTRRRELRPETDYSFPFISQGLADVIAAGGHGAIGAHGQQHGIGSQWEIWLQASALGPMGALEVASQGGAWFLGMQQDLGSIENGKLADLIVLNSNPLDNIRNTADIQFVMKGGRLYDGESLDQVWPDKKAFGVPYWADPTATQTDDRPLR
jgi:Tol biopolymer transport system component/imidazolonepropionase-like amidohydrolase